MKDGGGGSSRMENHCLLLSLLIPKLRLSANAELGTGNEHTHIPRPSSRVAKAPFNV